MTHGTRIPLLACAACLAAVLLAPLAGRAELKVVATTSEYGALAKTIGGARVTVTTIAKPTEDPHFVDARPSQIVAMHRADVLIEGGAELEIGWLAPLLDGARNPRILAGAPGRVVASQGIQLLDIPQSADRSQGDAHIAGNPHFMLDPENARIVAAHLARTFTALDAAGAQSYRGQPRDLRPPPSTRRSASGRTLLAPFKGRPIVTYHPTWRYFSRRFGLDANTFLEPKPGIPPSPPHLAQVIAKMQAQNIRVLLLEPYQPRKTAEVGRGAQRRPGGRGLPVPRRHPGDRDLHRSDRHQREAHRAGPGEAALRTRPWNF